MKNKYYTKHPNDFIWEKDTTSTRQIIISGELLREIAKLNLTNKEISEKTGLTESKIEDILLGKEYPSLDDIFDILFGLNLRLKITEEG